MVVNAAESYSAMSRRELCHLLQHGRCSVKGTRGKMSSKSECMEMGGRLVAARPREEGRGRMGSYCFLAQGVLWGR